MLNPLFQSRLHPHAIHVLMKFLLLLCMLLLASVECLALSAGEEEALLAIRASFPALALTSPPWTQNVSLACEPEPFYGLQCSEGPDPHVIGLYVALHGEETFLRQVLRISCYCSSNFNF